MGIQMTHGNGSFPEGDALHQQMSNRRQRGRLWSIIFRLSTIIGMLALVSLLFNILDSAVGLVAIQNTVDPDAIVRSVEAENLLTATHVVASESDTELAEGILGDPYAIGFFGYSYWQAYADGLRAVAVDGVVPTPETLSAEDYSLARPLYLYTTADILTQKPQVADFLHYYIDHMNEEAAAIGFFPLAEAELLATLERLEQATALAPTARDSDPISVVGSSTVYPLTQHMADQFAAAGFADTITVEVMGTTAGLLRFCQDDTVDIANASRAIFRPELEACRQAGREPIAFPIASDALAIVVSQANTFVSDLSSEQIRQAFTTATTWADLDPAWPAEPIRRFVPGANSGTLDFFVEAALGRELEDLPKETLIEILQANISAGLMRRFERDEPFAARSQASVLELVNERVIEPSVARSWSLTDSLLKRSEIEAVVAAIPNGELTWRSWVTPKFLSAPQSSDPNKAGIRPAILGSLWVILITLLIALPVGVGAAIYLEEYAANNRLNRLLETNINNLAGVPSIIYGMLGLAVFVRILEPLTSGKLFGLVDGSTANGRTVLSAGLTLALLVLPLIIINSREAIRAVPASLRQAGFGLGATKWQVIWHHVLPVALPGILTGNILAMSRAIGETAPLVVVGASTFIALDPNGPFAKFTTLPAQIYQWTGRPQQEFQHIAAAAIIVLLILLLSLNASAVWLRNRYSVRV